jgi:nicotinamidase-related amidase
MNNEQLPLPVHYKPDKIGTVWSVSYEELFQAAKAWTEKYSIPPASEDRVKICLLAVDMQNTFCTPEFELYVGGRTGTGAVDDTRRLCEFVYRNLDKITSITATLDTHYPIHVFHSLFLIDEKGNHPQPFTLVSADDVKRGKWKFNTAVAKSVGIDPEYGQQLLEYYTEELKKRDKFDLTIWPYHAMLGSIGHALVSPLEEAVFFHSVARNAQPKTIIKGRHPLTEHYSVLGPEIKTDHLGKEFMAKDDSIIKIVREYDAVIIAGEAKSHCVAWTVEDLMHELHQTDPSLLTKIYLLEDCSSPVVIPDVIDYTETADKEYNNFADAGMHIVRSTDPIDQWPGIISVVTSVKY